MDRASHAEDVARAAVIKQAQKSSHETQLALLSAPASRPVALATDTNAATVALLDQAGGPLDAGELARIRATIAGLLSENTKIREAAERERAKDQESIGEVSAALAAAVQRSDAAESKLRKAFDRENELANELRSQRALMWIAAGAAALCAAGWVYVRFFLGGLPGAFAKGISVLRADGKLPPVGEPNVFDAFLNRHEQELIAKHAR